MFLVRLPMFLGIGMRRFTQGGYERACKDFSESDLSVDMKGKHVMITGANQGLGYATARQLAKKGCTLFMVCRNAEKGRSAVEEVKAESGNPNIELLVCDMSSLSDIRKLASDFTASGKPLHVLINNAGVMVPPSKSSEGYEMNFATNTLGYYALTRALEPVLKKSVPARVIFVASGGALTEPLVVEDLEGTKMISKKNFPESQYARDKRRQVALCEGLAREWAGSGLSIYSMHPGWCETEGVKTSMPDFYDRFRASLRTIDQGADTTVWLAVKDEKALKSGEFYLDRAIQSKHLPLAGTGYSDSDVTALMAKLDEMVKPAVPSRL